jgi:hypothetical protein
LGPPWEQSVPYAPSVSESGALLNGGKKEKRKKGKRKKRKASVPYASASESGCAIVESACRSLYIRLYKGSIKDFKALLRLSRQQKLVQVIKTPEDAEIQIIIIIIKIIIKKKRLLRPSHPLALGSASNAEIKK